MEEKFDLKELEKRIKEVKEETKKLAQFTSLFLECLIKRHDLQNILSPEQEFEDVPREVVESILRGEVPSEEQINLMSQETQDYLLKECLFICGMGAVAYYSSVEESDGPSKFDNILEMSNQSPGHYVAMYLIAAFTLLFARIPSFEFIQLLCKDFDSSEENLEKGLDLYTELCLSVYNRYLEDKDYYGN